VEPAYAQLVEIVAGVKAICVSLKQWSLARIAEARRNVRGYEDAIDFQGLIKVGTIAKASGAQRRTDLRAMSSARNRRHGSSTGRCRSSPPVTSSIGTSTSRAPAACDHEVPAVRLLSVCRRPIGQTSSIRESDRLLPGAGRPEKQWPSNVSQSSLAVSAATRWSSGARRGIDCAGHRRGSRAAHDLPRTGISPPTRAPCRCGDTGPLHLAAALGVRLPASTAQPIRLAMDRTAAQQRDRDVFDDEVDAVHQCG